MSTTDLRLSVRAAQIMDEAAKYAKERGWSCVTSESILIGMTRVNEAISAQALMLAAGDPFKIVKAVESLTAGVKR